MAKGKLTPKQKKFADKYLETGNGTRSALAAYDTEDYQTAASIAEENLRKPEIIVYLDKHVEMAKSVITEIAQNKENKPSDRISAAKDILDRTVGKPKERIEQKSEQDITVKIISYADDNTTV